MLSYYSVTCLKREGPRQN